MVFRDQAVGCELAANLFVIEFSLFRLIHPHEQTCSFQKIACQQLWNPPVSEVLREEIHFLD